MTKNPRKKLSVKPAPETDPGLAIIPRVITQDPKKRKLHAKQARVLDRWDTIAMWLNMGYSIRKIAKDFHVSSKTIEKIANEEKIVRKKPGRPMTEETRKLRNAKRDQELQAIFARIDKFKEEWEIIKQEDEENERRERKEEEENMEYEPIGNPEKHLVKRKPRLVEDKGRHTRRSHVEE